MTRIYYYGFRDRYAIDPALVIRVKPNYRYDGLFGGDIRDIVPESSFKPVAYHSRYDADGHRNMHGVEPVDVVVLGDSYMDVGIDNADTFASRLEKISSLKVANYGIGWYGPFQYVEVLKRYALRNKPRIALFSIFEGNDMTDILQYMNWQKGGSYYHYDRDAKNIVQRYFLALKDTCIFVAKQLIPIKDRRVARIHLGNQTFHTAFVYGVDRRGPEELSRSVEVLTLKEQLREFRQLCLLHAITPVVLFIPTTAHIYLPYSEMPALGAGHVNQEKDHRLGLEGAIERAVDELRLNWISLTAPFEDAARQGKFVFYETDTHWNSDGRQIAAEVMSSYLASIPER